MLTNSCVKLQTVHTIPMTMNKEGEGVCFYIYIFFKDVIRMFMQFCTHLMPSADDESSGLYGFLNVIVHSASGLKQSLSKWLTVLKSSH